MDLEIVALVQENLIRFKMVEYQKINDNNKIQLEKIEEAILKITEMREHALHAYKDCEVNYVSVSSETGISRQTIDSNAIVLKQYITARKEEFEKKDLFSIIEKLKSKVKDLEDDNEKFKKKDIDYQVLRLEYKQLNTDLQASQEEKEILNKQNAELVKKIEKLEKQLPLYGHNVVNLHK